MDIKDSDMEKLEKAFFKNLQRDNCEYGGIGIDSKRPFGNSDVECDILEDILEENMTCDKCGHDTSEDGWSQGRREYAAALYDNLIDWLQKKYL